MPEYLNLKGDSNILSYEFRGDDVILNFKSGRYKHFLYKPEKPGRDIVDTIKFFAREGVGLDAYISGVVKDQYYRKW